jgi:hypothetical protein
MLCQLFEELDQLKSISAESIDLIEQLEFALTELTKFYDDNCVNFPEKRLYLAEAKQRFLTEFL